MGDCIFCMISRGEIPSNKVFENKHFYAFRDIQPVAPTHILIIPKHHIASIMDKSDQEEIDFMQGFFAVVRAIVKQEKLEETGFRLVVNNGEDAGQTVAHFHAHIIGGRKLGWPPFTD